MENNLDGHPGQLRMSSSASQSVAPPRFQFNLRGPRFYFSSKSAEITIFTISLKSFLDIIGLCMTEFTFVLTYITKSDFVGL